MKIKIEKGSFAELQILHDIQLKSFKSLLEIYQDYDMSPGNELI